MNVLIPDNYLSPRSSLNSYYNETLDHVESASSKHRSDNLIQKKIFVVSSKPEKTVTSINFSTSKNVK